MHVGKAFVDTTLHDPWIFNDTFTKLAVYIMYVHCMLLT